MRTRCNYAKVSAFTSFHSFTFWFQNSSSNEFWYTRPWRLNVVNWTTCLSVMFFKVLNCTHLMNHSINCTRLNLKIVHIVTDATIQMNLIYLFIFVFWVFLSHRTKKVLMYNFEFKDEFLLFSLLLKIYT